MNRGAAKWTPDEDQRLLDLRAAGTPLALIAKKLDRTHAAVDGRINRLRRAKAKGMTVWIYVDTSKDVGAADHLKVFANPEAADDWFEKNDPEGVAFLRMKWLLRVN